MKVHYINILLFALPLNILVSSKKNTYIKYNTLNTKLIRAHRTLCECELYALSNYDNDPEMKEVMQQFDRQSSQRFLEYDEHMQEKRRKCKDKCDKEIQKIILKDRIEKELAQELITLETKITTEDIPTCICEKSLADKTEKFCHNCGYGLGSIAPNIGLLGGPGIYGWKIAVLESVKEFAAKAGAAKGAVAGEAAGKNAIIGALQNHFKIHSLNGISLESFFTSTSYTEVTKLAIAIDTEMDASCGLSSFGTHTICALRGKLDLVAVPGRTMVNQKDAITKEITKFVGKAKGTANFKAAQVSSETSSKIIANETALIEAGFNSSITSINASIIAIVVIVLIMVIIYLILRYRRKKKMKKKLQYIKLLEE
ncbi:hypothetical protein PFDG_02505 [Plasmodium falciparum Dd2]|uniref:Rifin n=1 Tax=Plasmodium falciparum (isolate Dd2) TaxID=57267 RepID=A0A0L7M6Q3_PLAF4|nr:hypothetical protein PFDG_02505 [Plasmodium falciparum Dd2]